MFLKNIGLVARLGIKRNNDSLSLQHYALTISLKMFETITVVIITAVRIPNTTQRDAGTALINIISSSMITPKHRW